ncbi:MAG: UDP-N-acetylmuramoylalanyl-D-glutamyl-2, 6-diaminopimelate--D-alanyl-D-alanine ligase, partial [Dehalococcoidia bacterium]|nr:UDP-N-acetylmuramoylalanyl-D-glutamyl-2, 6-diaminopimelate--D-alanyl-D-alanine ligase [Dehalococcoidia bacterium]
TSGELKGEEKVIQAATQDSRKVTPGCLFIPLISERDGHAYIEEALSLGASAYLTEQEPKEGTSIRVENTGTALTQLGKSARFSFHVPVVGITGSVGKTSVKDMTNAVLSQQGEVHASLNSYNNEIGVPLTLLNTPDDSSFLVLEMGARKEGDIAELSEIAYPDIGVITTVVESHTEVFGSLDSISKTKGEILERLPSEGCAVLNADVEEVMRQSSRTRARKLTFGQQGEVRASSVEFDENLNASFAMETPWGRSEIKLNVAGEHMIPNALAAASVGLALGLPIESVAEGLSCVDLSPLRMEIVVDPNGTTVINDTYNANPTSMKAALDSLSLLPCKGRKVAFLGLMAELGEKTSTAHVEVKRYAEELGIEVIAVETELYGEPGIDNLEAVSTELENMRFGKNDALLFKASRVVGLEKVVKDIIT